MENTNINQDLQPAAKAAVKDPEKIVKTGGFLGWRILFAIPVIGWIINLVMAFTAKNNNVKNFAKASIIWLGIRIVLYAGIFFAAHLAMENIMEKINDELGTDYESISEMIEDISYIRDMMEEYGDYSDYLDGDLSDYFDGDYSDLEDYRDYLDNYDGDLDELFGGFGGDEYEIEDDEYYGFEDLEDYSDEDDSYDEDEYYDDEEL